MAPELGQYALILAFCLASIQAILPLAGLFRREPVWLAAARPAAFGQFAFVGLAFATLAYCFWVSDFSVVYVAANSNTALPWPYRLAAVWGGHEGSLLLWVLILGVWSVAVAVFSRRLPTEVRATVLSVMGMVAMGFLLFMLLTSSPFERQFPVPMQGRDLNPLLQDPGMVMHPPMLYMGYVGFSVAFAFAIAALINGRVDAAWTRWARPWTIAAWTFLSLGVTLGSAWSYRELGWGGWWFWDPVENASFMPWLVGTALIHSLAVTENRGLFKSWTVLLAICAFSLSLLGTFLVRSGVLVSVHAFATDPARGLYILAFFAVVVGGSLILYAWRAPRLSEQRDVNWFSREGLLLANNVLLVTAAATVLLGTLYPLIVDAMGWSKISVGPPYFNKVFVPLMLPLLVLVGFAMAVPWKRGRVRVVARRLLPLLLGAVLLGILVPWFVLHRQSFAVAAAAILAFWVVLTALHEPWRRLRARRNGGGRGVPRAVWGMTLAHVGLGLAALGIAVTSVFDSERTLQMAPGDDVTVAGYRFVFHGTRDERGPNYTSRRGEFRVWHDGRQVAVLHPEKRSYDGRSNTMTEAAIGMAGFAGLRDLYVSMGQPLAGQAWSIRIYIKPFVRLLWLGGLMMAVGGLLAISDRRYRLPVPKSKPVTAPDDAATGRLAPAAGRTG